jgi:signal transduction histidine kinase
LQQYATLGASVIHTAEMRWSLSQFMNEAAHNLQTPLSIIRAIADLLSAGTKQGNDEWEFWKNIYSQVQRMTRLVRDIVAVSWGQRDEREKLFQSMDLVQVAEACVREIRPLVEKQNVAASLHSMLDTAPMTGNPDKIAGAVQNLLENAIAATLHCAPPPEGHSVRVELSERHGTYELRVHDTGCGIHQDLRLDVWRSFFSTWRGHGIGLSAARAIVQFHGGTVEIESSVTQERAAQGTGGGSGTCFLIKLPRSREADTV